MGSNPILEKLERALNSHLLVCVERKLPFADSEDGFVVAIGSKWMLLQRVADGGNPDGYVAMRVKDVRRVRRDRSFAPTVARALPSWPPVAPKGIRLDDTSALLGSVATCSPLFGIEKQRERRAVWIGQLDRIADKKLWLLELNTKAKWLKKPEAHRFNEITSVAFGDRYLSSLALAAAGARHLEPA